MLGRAHDMLLQAKDLQSARAQLALKQSLVAEKDTIIASLQQRTGQVSPRCPGGRSGLVYGRRALKMPCTASPDKQGTGMSELPKHAIPTSAKLPVHGRARRARQPLGGACCPLQGLVGRRRRPAQTAMRHEPASCHVSLSLLVPV